MAATDVDEALDVVRLLNDSHEALTEVENNLARAREKLDEMDNVPGALVYVVAVMQENIPALINGVAAAHERMEVVAGKEPKP